MRYEERHEKYKNTVIVSYPFRWGGQMRDRWMWMAELNGGVWDYNTQDALVEDALESGYPVVVLRVHRGGTVSVLRHLTPASTRLAEQHPPAGNTQSWADTPRKKN